MIISGISFVRGFSHVHRNTNLAAASKKNILPQIKGLFSQNCIVSGNLQRFKNKYKISNPPSSSLMYRLSSCYTHNIPIQAFTKENSNCHVQQKEVQENRVHIESDVKSQVNIMNLVEVAANRELFDELCKQIANGSDLNVRDEDTGCTPLITVILYNPNTTLVEILIDNGADVNQSGPYKLTALMVAALKGRFSILQYLVSKGANINAKDILGQTALDKAKISGHIDIANYLQSIIPG